MAGFQIVDTYKAYKVREKKVTTWLKDTAQKLGFKGSAKKPSENHPIRINEIPEAVKLIVSKGEYVYYSTTSQTLMLEPSQAFLLPLAFSYLQIPGR